MPVTSGWCARRLPTEPSPSTGGIAANVRCGRVSEQPLNPQAGSSNTVQSAGTSIATRWPAFHHVPRSAGIDRDHDGVTQPAGPSSPVGWAPWHNSICAARTSSASNREVISPRMPTHRGLSRGHPRHPPARERSRGPSRQRVPARGRDPRSWATGSA